MPSLVQDKRINLIIMFANVQVTCMQPESHRKSTYVPGKLSVLVIRLTEFHYFLHLQNGQKILSR